MMEEGGSTTAADGLFDDATRWKAIASGHAELRLSSAASPVGPGLRLDYDFKGGGGFVVARLERDLHFTEAWEIRFLVRGGGPANTIEIKLANLAGTSVWRCKRDCWEAPAEWTEFVVASREIEFAWGPAGGGSITHASALEIAVVAGPGGCGSLELADFRVVDRSFTRIDVVEATSSAPGTSPSMAVDGIDSTCWRSSRGDGPHTLTLDFGEDRDLGGLVVHWDAAARPRAFHVETALADGAWRRDYEAAHAGVATSFVSLPDTTARRLRLTAFAADADAGIGIVQLHVAPFEWSRSPTEFLTNVAMASPRGEYPRYLLREQTYWTPVGSPTSGPVGLLSDDGAVEVGEGGFLVEPVLIAHSDAGSRTIRWSDVERSTRLEVAPLPIATAAWRADDVGLEVTPFVEGDDDAPRLLVRYRVTGHATDRRRFTLGVALRPYQVTPPWQAWRGMGGPSPIRRLVETGGGLRVNDDVTIRPLGECDAVGAADFDEGGIAALLAGGSRASRSALEDETGRGEGVLFFALELAAGESREVFVECLLPARPRRSSAHGAGGAVDVSVGAAVNAGGAAAVQASGGAGMATDDGASRLAAAVRRWREALGPLRLRGGSSVAAVFDAATTSIAHVLLCRDGVALQPGPRRYTRSWIRDGAIMAASLLRAGCPQAARAFVAWYAPFQYADGFVPCCVDRNGVDPLVEHDSHGQLIFAVAETFRFTGDEAFALAMWSHCASAVAKIEALRATRKTDEFREGRYRNCHGLLPESASHEGYLAHPVHSYWDDFWALRGLRDAAFLGRSLGLDAEALAADAAARDLETCIAESMLLVMRECGLATVPASVEWADFDPTAVAGALSLVGAVGLFPREALEKTFDQYMAGFRARRDGSTTWNNYSAYEVRVIGALVRLGRRDDANELLDYLLADRRPSEWAQWPEITWYDPAAPAHLGDLPHCWIGGEFAYAFRSMLVFEREEDDALVVGAGLREAWLDEGDIEVRALPTRYGPLDLSIRRDAAGAFVVTTGGGANPPGGIVLDLPPRH